MRNYLSNHQPTITYCHIPQCKWIVENSSKNGFKLWNDLMVTKWLKDWPLFAEGVLLGRFPSGEETFIILFIFYDYCNKYLVHRVFVYYSSPSIHTTSTSSRPLSVLYRGKRQEKKMSIFLIQLRQNEANRCKRAWEDDISEDLRECSSSREKLQKKPS